MAKKAESKNKAKSKPVAKPAKPAVKVAKPAAKKPPAKVAAKPAPKPAKAPPKPAAKAPAKPVAKTPAKPEHKPKHEAKAPVKVPAKAPEPAPFSAESKATGPGTGRKGITIVAPKVMKKPPAKPPAHSYIPASVGRLFDPKSPIRRPLIPSGPKAAHIKPLGSHRDSSSEPDGPKAKSPYNKRELERFRQILIKKRAELAGDVSTMENEALRGQSGSLSNMPQHLAEQGSEAYDQALSLDLAAADRKLIREIDDALKRIEAGTFGICEVSGKPISAERLEELPWARYSIETARELERQHLRS